MQGADSAANLLDGEHRPELAPDRISDARAESAPLEDPEWASTMGTAAGGGNGGRFGKLADGEGESTEDQEPIQVLPLWLMVYVKPKRAAWWIAVIMFVISVVAIIISIVHAI